MQWRKQTLGCMAVIAVLIGSCASAGQSPSLGGPKGSTAGTGISIDNFSFGPGTLTVPVGTTVTWTNRDDIPHTVVSADDPKTFKSRVLDTDEKFSYTFKKAGTYSYFCSIHPKMTAKVVAE